MSSETFKIRPAGRHILTIGRDLIQDPYAAIVELVKNAYDADASLVSVFLKRQEEKKSIEIVVEDDGVGMTRDVVINHWMVPSTDNKKKNKVSPSGRIAQGRKGIGRYSASILGDEMVLETVSSSTKEKTEVYVDWDLFEKAEFLSDVDILIETNKSTEKKGTRITITGGKKYLEEWGDKEFVQLQKELRKIISPIRKDAKDEFQIVLHILGFPYMNGCFEEKMEPFPLFELYDYRIHGEINKDGKGILKFETQKIKNSVVETMDICLNGATGCGSVSFDIRVFDRDKESIQGLINRGLRDSSGHYVGKLEARRLLNENNGIGVYRNGFRIRPLGDPQFDWLELNRKRVQNPSMKIGSDQVIGIVTIESEEFSGLIEKSARDGLKDNEAYAALKSLTAYVISKLEERRYNFRYINRLGSKQAKIERDLERMASFSSLRKNIDDVLKNGDNPIIVKTSILSAIDEAEKESKEIVQSIKETIAVYQGQATVGKIINVVLHEARKPLAFFKNQIPLFNRYYKDYIDNSSNSEYSKQQLPLIYEKINQIPVHSEILVNLFKKIDPLAMGQRGKKKKIPVIAAIKDVLSIFKDKVNDTEIVITGAENQYIECWVQDFYAVVANLIENSIYWLNKSNQNKSKLEISIMSGKNGIEYIDFRDNGPGIDSDYIESQIIFEPHFTTKPDGSGLGLAIAGEAAERFGFDLIALSSDNGAYFRLQKKG